MDQINNSSLFFSIDFNAEGNYLGYLVRQSLEECYRLIIKYFLTFLNVHIL